MKKGVCVAVLAWVLCGCPSDTDDDESQAGSGGSGGSAGTGPVVIGGCEEADTSLDVAALYAGASEALTSADSKVSSCGAIDACHKGRGKAGLVLLGAQDLNTLLVGKASCEVPNIPLVDSSGGDTGLEHSWLWIKLTAPTDSLGQIVAKPEWGTPGNCNQDMTGTFGLRMPWGLTGDSYLKDESMAKIRNWICAGAPSP